MEGTARLPQAQLDEAEGLADAIGLDVILAAMVTVNRPRPATLFGTGKVEELAALIAAENIEVAVMDTALSPIQQRNLERAWHCKVIDRTGLILEIFAERAHTKEGRLQVELARLTYQRSRLVRSWTHLERQRGGTGTVGGPGETQIEADRRMIDDRVLRLRRELEAVVRTRELHRKNRRDVSYPVVALVGYTNAGKSTLFNRLTGAAVIAEDQLFATLDPTMRAVEIPGRGGRIILSDTVGFVSALPTQLVAAFRATLEEVLGADVIIHVRDIVHPDSEAQKADVLAVLSDLGVDAPRRDGMIEVFNKIDRASDDDRRRIANLVERSPLAVAVSAFSGEGCEQLLALIGRQVGLDERLVRLALPHQDGATLAWLYQIGEIVERRDDEQTVWLVVKLNAANAGRLEKRLGSALDWVDDLVKIAG
ncbi:MAG: GTPase HflX [Proteobacteria bacterium]|nr:GTPase HflX [Pseudomonadota bacterium]